MTIDKILNDKHWIFVNYVPGSFGSFITKVIETSPAVYNTPGEAFNKRGSSHLSQTLWIKGFHDGNAIDNWSDLDPQDRIKYIIDNTTELYHQTDLYKVHKFTVPKLHNLFLETFPKSKFIKVIYDERHHDTIVDLMCNKTYPTTLEKYFKQVNPQLYKVLTSISAEKQRIWYRKQCENRIISVRDNRPAERTHLFNVSNLFNGKHDTAFDKLFKFLGIVPGNYDKLIEDFLQIHQHIKV